jgi:RNA polymerase sigma-70 factor, ECF subfamily
LETYTTETLAVLGVTFVPQTLRYLGVPEEVLRDAAQDVLVVALRRLGDFEQRSTLKTWVYGICIRIAQEQRRKRKNVREILVEELPEITTPPGQETAVETAQWRRALAAVLDTVSPKQREAFVLYEIQRLSMREVADVLGCPLQTAYFRCKAGRARVLDAFKKQAHEGERSDACAGLGADMVPSRSIRIQRRAQATRER